MGCNLKRIFLLFILILLQSCSGGRIGNFLDSTFKNIEEPKIEKDSINNKKNKLVINSGGNLEKNKNIEEPKIEKDTIKNKENNLVINSGGNLEKNKNIEEPIIKVDIRNNLKKKKIKKPEERSEIVRKSKNQIISLQKKKYQPQTYKIIFILKDVDPKNPTEDLTNILRNSDVNFEIEKIERFFDPKNKSIKSN